MRLHGGGFMIASSCYFTYLQLYAALPFTNLLELNTQKTYRQGPLLIRRAAPWLLDQDPLSPPLHTWRRTLDIDLIGHPACQHAWPMQALMLVWLQADGPSIHCRFRHPSNSCLARRQHRSSCAQPPL